MDACQQRESVSVCLTNYTKSKRQFQNILQVKPITDGQKHMFLYTTVQVIVQNRLIIVGEQSCRSNLQEPQETSCYDTTGASSPVEIITVRPAERVVLCTSP